MKQLLLGKYVCVRGMYSGTYCGTIVNMSDDFKVIQLSDASQIRKIVTNDTSGGIAKIFHGTPVEKPDIEKVDYNNGTIFLTENFEVVPLDQEAINFIKKYEH